MQYRNTLRTPKKKLLICLDAILKSNLNLLLFSLSFEPVCLEAFNDARECLFKLDGQMRVCEPELNLFEECVHDPVRFEKF